MGVMQNFGAGVVGMTVGPVLLTQLAAHFGWRTAFYVSCLPGLILVAFIYFTVRPLKEAPPAPRSVLVEAGGEPGFWSIFRSRNLVLALVISALFSGWLIIQGVFLPRYLNEVDGIKPTDIGLLLTLSGPGAAISGILVPWWSDRIGRRPAMTLLTLVGLIMPLVILFVHGPFLFLALALFLGALGGGAGSLYIGVVPAEAVPRRHLATAVALALASGELFGGVIGPFVAGRAADVYGLAAPFWISAGCAAACVLLSLFLVETAPRKTKAAVVFDSPGVATDAIVP